MNATVEKAILPAGPKRNFQWRGVSGEIIVSRMKFGYLKHSLDFRLYDSVAKFIMKGLKEREE